MYLIINNKEKTFFCRITTRTTARFKHKKTLETKIENYFFKTEHSVTWETHFVLFIYNILSISKLLLSHCDWWTPFVVCRLSSVKP